MSLLVQATCKAQRRAARSSAAPGCPSTAASDRRFPPAAPQPLRSLPREPGRAPRPPRAALPAGPDGPAAHALLCHVSPRSGPAAPRTPGSAVHPRRCLAHPDRSRGTAENKRSEPRSPPTSRHLRGGGSRLRHRRETTRGRQRRGCAPGSASPRPAPRLRAAPQLPDRGVR